MVTERKTEQTSEEVPTWRDYLPRWVASPKVITRAELLAKIPGWGVEVSERTLRFWETEGALPRAVRQSHHGVVQAVYPEWYALAVAAVYWRRQQGVPLPVIAADRTRLIEGLVSIHWAFDNKIMPLDATEQGKALIPPLAELVEYASEPDNPITRAVITLSNSKGEVAFSLLWVASSAVVSDGEPAPPPSDILLSDGVRSSLASDS